MDAASADVATGAFDAVVSRNGLMFTPHLDRALAGARRALRSGGRFATIVWSTEEKNPLHAIVFEVARRSGLPPGPTPEVLLAYSLSDPIALAAALSRAGFSEVSVETAPVARRLASTAAALEFQRKSPAAALFSHHPAARREEAWAEVARAYERFATPHGWAADGESLVASGTA